jgi:hypothetical protein
MLLAFSAKPVELEVLLLSVTFGNIDVQRSAYRSLIHSLNVKLCFHAEVRASSAVFATSSHYFILLRKSGNGEKVTGGRRGSRL